MAKTRGCSCWPFFKSKPSPQTQTKKKPSILQTSQNQSKQSSRHHYANNLNNIVVIQRSPSNNHPQFSSQQQSYRSRTTDILRTGNVANFEEHQQIFEPSAPPLIMSSRVDEIRNRNKVRIKTNFSKNQIKFQDEYPSIVEDQKIYKYCCPICLRYFNTILVSSCCKNYICRLCIGEMAKKAKKDVNFIIKCPHCFECEFKLDDVNLEDKVKFYTDTPFKYIKNSPAPESEKSQSNTLLKDSTLQEKTEMKNINPSSGQKSSQAISPSFQIHLTDISYHKGIRNSASYRLQPILMSSNQINEDLINNVPEGDMDQPVYESPYPSNQDIINEALSERQLIQNFNEREELKIDDQDFNLIDNNQQCENINISNRSAQNDQKMQNNIIKKGRKLSVKSIPLFKNEANTFMDTLQIENSASNQKLKKLITEQNKENLIQNNLQKDSKRQINNLYQRQAIQQSLSNLQNKYNCSNSQQQIIRNNSSFKTYKINFKEYDEKTQLRNFGQYLRSRQPRNSSISNHSNKSEEMKSSIKQRINDINHFARDNLSPNNLYIRHSNLTVKKESNNRSRVIPLKQLIQNQKQGQQAEAQDPQVLYGLQQLKNTIFQQKSEAKRKNSLIMRTSQQILSPLNMKIDDQPFQLRERKSYVNMSDRLNGNKEEIFYKD